MGKKHFSILLLVTVVVAALVLLVPGNTGKESAFQKHRLLPGLATLVNEIEYVQLTGAGDETIATLNRRGGKWLVAESSNYRADWTVLRQLLSDLAGAEVIEGKTSNPEFYTHLGVEDVDGPDAAGVLIGFAEETGLPSLIVGNKAQGREGQYVRLLGSDQSALIDRVMTVPRDVQQWLDREIIDVQEGELVEISITHPDGEQVFLQKASADDADFKLQNVPEGREIKSSWAVNSIGGGMATLRLDAVVPKSEIDWSDAVGIRLLTADGLQVSAQLVSQQDQHWISLNASVYRPAASREPVEAGAETDV
ncbi:MAG: DUF4340 domain-containing protein, partial [Xanthomonadales bacterium]